MMATAAMAAQRTIYIQNHFIHFGTMESYNVTLKCWWEHVSNVPPNISICIHICVCMRRSANDYDVMQIRMEFRIIVENVSIKSVRLMNVGLFLALVFVHLVFWIRQCIFQSWHITSHTQVASIVECFSFFYYYYLIRMPHAPSEKVISTWSI